MRSVSVSAILPGSRIVMREAMAELLKVFPPLNLKVYVHGMPFMCCARTKKWRNQYRKFSASLDVNSLGMWRDLAGAATFLVISSMDTAVFVEHMQEARRRKIEETTSSKKVRGLMGAVFCEMRDLGITLSSWQVFQVGRWKHDQ